MKKSYFIILLLITTLIGCGDCSDCGKLTSEQVKPPNFASIENAKQKKTEFFGYLYPLAIEANQQILNEKLLLRQLVDQTESLSADQMSEVEVTAKYYKVDCDAFDKTCANNIHRKIGMVPPSLVMAQAANESAWGTSRFALEGNNYFGQWCYSKGCGLKPSQRDSGANHEVRKFENPFESVKSYMHNINTSMFYKQLRDTRREAWRQNKKPNGVLLANGLIKYSERGVEYVEEIQHMIRYNKLLEFDKTFWMEMDEYKKQSK